MTKKLRGPEPGVYLHGPGGPVTPPPLPDAIAELDDHEREPTGRRYLASVPPEEVTQRAWIESVERRLLTRQSDPPLKKAERLISLVKAVVPVLLAIASAIWAAALYTDKLVNRDDLAQFAENHEVAHRATDQSLATVRAELAAVRVELVRAELRAAQARDRLAVADLDAAARTARGAAERQRLRVERDGLLRRIRSRQATLGDLARVRRMAEAARTDPTVLEEL